MKPKPSTGFEIEPIPLAMREAPRWVCWRPEMRDGKWTKVPVNARTGGNAKANDPTTWCTLAEAEKAATADHGLGIGFMLGDGWLGVDLDGVVDPATGKITDPDVEAWLATTESYVETTPSKTGLHVIFKGVEIPAWSQNRRGFVEVYADKRFFTVTGHARYNDRDVLADQAAVDSLCHKWLRKDAPRPPSTATVPSAPRDPSADDYAVACNLLRAGRPEAEIADALALSMRARGRDEKADRHDYIPRTIASAREELARRAELPASVRRDTPKPLRVAEWRAFPVETLPGTIRGWVDEHARAKGVDPSFVALPLLVACAGFIGNTVAVRVRGDWVEPIALWVALVAPSGSKKSPAMKAAMKPFRDAQGRHYAETKRSNEGRDPKEHGKPPRRFVEDATPEAMLGLLESNPRGLLAHRDELAELLAGFGKYKSGKQAALGEAALACKLYDATPTDVDRKSTGHAHIPRPLVSIVGAIPPKTARTLFAEALQANGFFPRFVLVRPPVSPARFTEEDPDWRVDAALDRLVRRLDAIPLRVNEETGVPDPTELSLDPHARAAWVKEHDRLGEHALALGDGVRASSTSKTAGLLLRLAGILHVVGTDDGREPPDVIDGETMRRAIALGRWLHEERLRVFELLDADEAEAALADFARGLPWAKYPDGITPREVFELRKTRFADAEGAEAELERATVRGYLESRFGVRGDPAKGGRETMIYKPRTETPADSETGEGFEVSC